MKKKALERRGFVLALLILSLAALVVLIPFQFRAKAGAGKGMMTRTTSNDPAHQNYDIRIAGIKEQSARETLADLRAKAGKDAYSVSALREGFKDGEAALKLRVPTLKVEYSDALGNPELIGPDAQMGVAALGSPVSGKRAEALRDFLRNNSSLFGVRPEQADKLQTTADYTNPAGNMSFARLEQKINGIPVFSGEVNAGFDRDGRMVRVMNGLAPGVEDSLAGTDFGDAADAVRAAFSNVSRPIGPEDTARDDSRSDNLKVTFSATRNGVPTQAEKMYFPTEPGVVVPAWRVMIDQNVNMFYVIVDAASGKMLWRKNLTADQTQTATYNVYNDDSPGPLSPTTSLPGATTQGAAISRTDVTVINEMPTGQPFSSDPWIADGAGKDRKSTRLNSSHTDISRMPSSA